ncbi:MAG: arsenate reductase (glutaredoxin) [Candidatus Phaeomarinobacter sp.]
MTLRIYHNPRCSKSRQTLTLLQENGHTPEVIEYLKSPPTADELRDVLQMLGMSPRDLMRKGEAVYKELELGNASLSDEQLIDAIVANPILIERPIVIAADKAAIGRPPERVLDIL